jgi:hypothetical protein
MMNILMMWFLYELICVLASWLLIENEVSFLVGLVQERRRKPALSRAIISLIRPQD